MQTLDDKYPTLFCFTMINENLASSARLALYKDTIGETVDESAELNKIYEALLKEDNVANLHDHAYYQVLTLCHQDSLYVKKWVAYVNREKLDCMIEYNKANLGMVDSKTTIINSGASQGSLEQLAIKAQQDQENRDRLEKQEEEERKNGV